LTITDEYSLAGLRFEEGWTMEISRDLKSWQAIPFLLEETSRIKIPPKTGLRYLRFKNFNTKVSSFYASKNNNAMNNSNWRGSNLFGVFEKMKFQKYWHGQATITEAADDSFISVAIHGKHGIEGAYCAIKAGNSYIGAPDRSPSFPCNNWENVVAEAESAYTYYFPVNAEILNREIEFFVLGRSICSDDLKINVWITSPTQGLKSRELVLYPA
jgi:hypothetical protein